VELAEMALMTVFAALLFFGIWVISGWLIRSARSDHPGSHPA
jgi:hypothetical protein